jgi:hypothetical protein
MRFFSSLWTKANAAVQRAADTFRDVVLDWNTEPAFPPGTEPLPPVDTDTLVEALREPVEEIVRALAALLNEAETAADLTVNRPLLRQLCEEMLAQVTEQGMRLRIDAAVAGLPAIPGPGPRSAWVERYRSMLAAEGRLPASRSRE